LIFDLNDEITYNKIPMWIHLVKDVAKDMLPIFILVGNKCDSERKVCPKETILKFCQTHQIAHYIETSTFTGTGIHELHQIIIKCAFNVKTLCKTTKNIELQTKKNNKNSFCEC